MTDQEQINDLACVLDKAKIDAMATIGSLNNGFGQWYAKAVYNAGYRKVPNGDIVLTKEDLNLFAKDCIAGELTGLDIINALIERAKRKEAESRKKSVKEFAEKLKQYIKQNEVQTKFFGGKCFINEETIDELLKEYEVGE